MFCSGNGTGERGSCRARLSSWLERTVIEDLHQTREDTRGWGHARRGALPLVSTVSICVAAKTSSAGASISRFGQAMEKHCFARGYGTGERGSCRARLSSRLERTVIEDLHQTREDTRGWGHARRGALSLVTTVSIGVAAKSSWLERTVIEDLHQTREDTRGWGHARRGALPLVSTVSICVAAKTSSAGASISRFARVPAPEQRCKAVRSADFSEIGLQ